MNLDDFRCMRRGKQFDWPKSGNLQLLEPVDKRNGKNRRALLMLHGFSSSPAVFRQFTDHLNYYDAIVIPVLPGHAVSLQDFSRVRGEEWIASTRETCASLTKEFEQVDVLGFSLGGLLACDLSTKFSLRHLYLLAPALDLLLPGSNFYLMRLLQWLGFTSIRSHAGNLYTNNHCEIAYRQIPLATGIEIISLIRKFPFSLPSCPTDVFLGCHDQVINSLQVAARFAQCDHVNLHWLTQSAHVLPLDGDVGEIISCIRRTQKEPKES